MLHIPIVKTDEQKYKIEFSHFIHPLADDDTWQSENEICLDHIKINIFVSGDFFIIINGSAYKPHYSDICVLPPHTMHHGKIPKPTKLEYYQLDIGVSAFFALEGGEELLRDILDAGFESGFILNPLRLSEDLFELLRTLELAINENRFPMAFAYTVEIIDLIARARRGSAVAPTPLSRITRGTIRYIEEHFSGQVKMAGLSKLLGVSQSYISRTFKKEIGVSVHEYLTKYRILKAAELLRCDSTVAEACYACGFCDSSHFISNFKREMGSTPNEYKKRFM